MPLNNMSEKNNIRKKIKSFKEENLIKNNITNKQNNFSFAYKISVDLVASVVVGCLIGLGIDYLFNSKPIFFLIFLFLGIAAGFWNMYRTFISLNK